jgi:hypothetical protein
MFLSAFYSASVAVGRSGLSTFARIVAPVLVQSSLQIWNTLNQIMLRNRKGDADKTRPNLFRALSFVSQEDWLDGASPTERLLATLCNYNLRSGRAVREETLWAEESGEGRLVRGGRSGKMNPPVS